MNRLKGRHSRAPLPDRSGRQLTSFFLALRLVALALMSRSSGDAGSEAAPERPQPWGEVSLNTRPRSAVPLRPVPQLRFPVWAVDRHFAQQNIPCFSPRSCPAQKLCRGWREKKHRPPSIGAALQGLPDLVLALHRCSCMKLLDIFVS